jgi:hypothetical protein
MRANQRGITLMGFLIVLSVAGFFAYLGMRLFPVYIEYYGVVTAMKSIQNEPGAAQMSPEQIRLLLDRRFDISGVNSVKREHIKITRERGYNLTITYEVRRPMIYNIDFVAMFDNTVDLAR